MFTNYHPVTNICSFLIQIFYIFQDLQPDKICYEPLEDYDRIRDNAKFWLEGVAILVVGIFGLFGNLLSIFILRRSRGNKGFNTLLVMYVFSLKTNSFVMRKNKEIK